MLDFECFKKGYKMIVRVMTPTLKRAIRLLQYFIPEAAILRKDFCFTPLRRVLQILLLIYELLPDLCRSRFMILRGKVFIGPLSLSSGCFYHDFWDGVRKNRTRMITQLHLALLLLFPPCGCWWYSELCITCSPHSLACIVNPEERCYLRFYEVHKSMLLPRAS